MSVSPGTLVYASDYNSLQAIIAPVLGTGSGDTGYGQTVSSSQLSIPATSTLISVAQWNALRTDILACYNHQQVTSGVLTQPTTSIQLSAADFNAYLAMAQSCVTNRFLFDNTSYASVATSLTATQNGNTWARNNVSQTLYIDATCTMTQTQARYFFNTGSTFRIAASLSGSWGVTSKDFSWQSALSQMGTIAFGAHRTTSLPGATSPGTGSNIGYYELTSSFQTVYTKATTSYLPNKVVVRAKAVTSGSNVTITIRTQFEDDSTGTVDEIVQGVLSYTLSSRYPSGGGIVITPPTVTGSFSISPTVPA